MLSRNYTVKTLFAEAIWDIREEVYRHEFQALHVVNRAVQVVASQFYSIMINDYMTKAVVVLDEVGKYSTGGDAYYTADTNTILVNDINEDFEFPKDLWKSVMFRIGESVYYGLVIDVTTTNTVRIIATDLPASDASIDEFLMPNTMLDDDVINIAGLPIMRTGQRMRMTLHSTAVKRGICDHVSIEEINEFQSDSFKEQGRIVFAPAGEELLLRRAEDVENYGTLTLRFPRIPFRAISEDSYIDLPDGAPIEIAILKTKIILSERLKDVQIPDPREEMVRLVRSLFDTFGFTAELEEIKQKVEALT